MADANALAQALSFNQGQEKLVKGYNRNREETIDAPVQAFGLWDSVPLVQSALAELENGDFRTAALLCEATGRDDRITATMDARINGVLSLPLDFEPGIENNEKAAKVAEEVKASWATMFPEATLASLIKWGRLVGVAPGELVWAATDTPEGKRWVPTLKIWHPQFLYWDWSKRDFMVLTQSAGSLPIGEAPGQWLLYCPKGRYLAWQAGLIRALAIIFLVRMWALRDWARHSEKFGLCIVKAIVPKGADKDVKNTYFESIAGLGSENTIKIEVGNKDEASFGAELLEPKQTATEVFQGLIQQCDSSIAILALGQNLTTEVKGGAFAAAKVHDRVRGDFLRSDAVTLSTTLREQVLKPYAAFNFGDPELAPRPKWKTDPPEDAKDTSQAALNASQALTSMQTAKAPVNERQFLEKFNIPLYSEEEWDEIKAEREEEAQAALEQAQLGEPGQAVPPSKKKPGKGKKNAPSAEPDENETAKPKAMLPPELMKVLRELPITGWDKETVVARAKILSQLGTPLERPTAQAKDGLPEGHVRGQVFADDLADDAIRSGANALGPDLAGVLDDVLAMTSYDDLRARLLKRLKGMDRTAVAEVVERATILAHSAGRLAVVESTPN